MKRSTDRFLDHHTGSLPRPGRPDPHDVRQGGRRAGRPRRAGRARARGGRPRWCSKQVEAGIDIVNDGEMSKPSYATYIKDRLDRLRRHRQHLRLPGPRRFPEPGQARVRRSRPLAPQDAGLQRADRRARCRGGRSADVDNLQGRASPAATAHEAFMSAASPGVISLFFRNDHYPDHEAYLFAIADAMRHEYETVAEAGFVLQIDCPDLGMGRHIQYADLSLDEFRKTRAAARRGAQPRARQHPARAAAHAPVLGQLRGPAPLRRAARRHHRHRVHGAAAARSRSRPPIRATRTSGRCSRRVKLPDGKVLIPGVIESKSNFIEHPELIAQRIAPLRASWSAARTSSPAATAATAPGSARPRSIPTWCGRSSPRWPRARASPRRSSGRVEAQSAAFTPRELDAVAHLRGSAR